MKKKQLTAILLSAVMAVSACMPMAGMTVFAAEDAAAEDVAAENTEQQSLEEALLQQEDMADEEMAEQPEPVLEEEISGSKQDAAPEAEEADEVEFSEKEDAEQPASSTQEVIVPEENAPETDAQEETTSKAPQEAAADDASPCAIEEETGEKTENNALNAPGQNEFLNADDILAGDTKEAAVSESSPYAIWKFTPTKSGFYCFRSTAKNADTFGEIYDSGYALIGEDDESGTDGNFKISSYFEEGNTYYLAARLWNMSDSATIPVDLSIDNTFRVCPEGSSKNEADLYISPDGSLTLRVFVSAGEGSILQYSWYHAEEFCSPDGMCGENFVLIDGADTGEYTISSLTKPERYQCTVKDQYGNEGTAYFNVYVENHLVVYPEGGAADDPWLDMTVRAGDPVTLKVIATADDASQLSYCWFVADPTVYPIDGADTAEYQPDLKVSRKYECRVEDKYGNSILATFNIKVDNELKAIPEESKYGKHNVIVDAVPGEPLTLRVNISAIDDSELTIQWDRGGAPIDGANTAEYTIASATEPDLYRCLVNDPYGNFTLAIMSISFNHLRAYPEGIKDSDTLELTVAPNAPVTLKVVAEADDASQMTYRWVRDNKTVKGANTNTLNISSVDQNANYYCEVTDRFYTCAYAYFNITLGNPKTDIARADITVSDEGLVYDGTVKQPTVSVEFGGMALEEGTDYTVTCGQNSNAGTYPVTINGTGEYEGTVEKQYVIRKAEQTLTADALKLKIGESAKAVVKGAQGALTFASADTAIATVAEDGTVTAVAEGTTKITVNAAETDNYEAAEVIEIVVEVVSSAIDVSELEITVDDAGLAYNGNEKTPKVTVKYDGTAVTEGFTVSYENNVNAGLKTAKAVVTGDGKTFIGTKEAAFTILPGKSKRGDMFNLANNVKITWQAVPGAKYYKIYRSGIKDPVLVTSGLVGYDNAGGLVNGQKYTYKIVASLTGKGNSSGDSPLSYSKVMYRLKTVAIKSVKNTAAGKVTVKYDKTTAGDSYVLQYSEKQDMTGAKTKVVAGANTTTYVIGSLKKGKTYYISIRVRKKVDGIDYYTTFGVPKKVTVVK